jgi:ATP-binding cassette, subfamily B, bacterial
MDCAPTCLKMIAKHYGKSYSLEYLRAQSYLTREGVSLLGASECAEKIGFRSLAVKVPVQKLIDDAPLPCILHWNQNHFVVLYKIIDSKFSILNSKFNIENSKFFIADPGHGLIKLDKETFLKSWQGANTEGIALLLEPTNEFYNSKLEIQNPKSSKGFRFLFTYLKPYKKYILQLFFSMIIGSMLSLIFPFLTQSLVDYGINHQNVGFVTLILISQLVLFAGSMAIEMIRSWLMLHMNSRINISIISDFLMKLMKLPISYFDTKLIGDIKQRIGDHQRIQSFMTGSTLSTIFSFVNLIVFTFVLGFYSGKILLIFALFSILSITWILLFLKKRKELDYTRFQRSSDNENVLFELITGMQEIKLNNCETPKRWGWERVQAKLFKLNIQSLALGQYQQIGSQVFNQLKNILISYISAREVMSGNMTLGMMMSVSYIIGQMNSPIEQILGFIQSAQDAKISLDRLGEIHNKENEEQILDFGNENQILDCGLQILDSNSSNYEEQFKIQHQKSKINNSTSIIQNSKSIILENVSYQYQGQHSPFVLKNINLTIPQGKVTAIVGTSGSGKTTLLKLLLKFYDPVSGKISLGKTDLKDISPAWLRSKCGTVMQEGYVFSDTIANNISVSDEKTNQDKLRNAVKVANIKEFIDELPLNYNTKIGNAGSGISAGQKQRLLIARAVYKNPDYLFFDEATSALDANNEKVIMENLDEFFKGKTVVVIAHRLSTVKNADQIVVLEHGKIAEIGTHATLVASKGKYFELVKNQLELGN